MNDDWRFLGMYGMVTDASTSRVTVEDQVCNARAIADDWPWKGNNSRR